MKIKPLADRVVIKAAEPDEKVQGGIIIPDTAKEKPQKGEVMAAGPGRISDDGKLVPMTVKVKDTVLYGKYSGNEEYLIIRESDILAVV
jgi:chaperonin GroES